jgi:acetate kinase
MAYQHASRLLTINTGSSSLKAALYEMGQAERLDLAVLADRIGLPGSQIRITDAQGKTLLDEQRDLKNHESALQTLFDWLQEHAPDKKLDAVGHRVVHGGSRYSTPQLIDADLVRTLQVLVPIDPNHLPQAISAIQTVTRLHPHLPQVACFDTAFHRTMPRVAQMFALPRTYWDAGVVRYGFHGLSYEYIIQELRAQDRMAASGRVIIAHLGNGASMAAVRDSIGIDTTMGFTPTGGLVMGTRTGDLDPGVLLYLLESQGMYPAALNTLVNRRSGLLGVSGISADMHDLLDKASSDKHAAEAIDLFCYQAKKFLGAFAAVLGGLDTLVFTGGIGEHAAPVRRRICEGLEFLGIALDEERNEAHAPIISRDGSAAAVRVMKTNEDLMIARHTYRLVS